jgi:large subunit ribosomal protein L17
MRHLKHRHQLGVRKEHRDAIMAALASALFRHDRIQTTLAKAKALRPFAEKIITLAKDAAATEDTARKLHLRRLALARVRDESAVHFLFTDKVQKFLKRSGGYIRIYKLVKRVGDAADMAIVELIEADDEGYKKAKAPAAKKTAKKAAKKTAKKTAETAAPAAEASAAAPEAESKE